MDFIMPRLPRALSILLCDRLAAAPITGAPSFEGVFNAKTFDVFPSPRTDFLIYAALYDGRGEGKLEVEVVWLNAEATVFLERRWLIFAARHYTVNVIVPVRHLAFPGPGRYKIELRFDDQVLTDRLLDLYAGQRE
jgi:hypothetical protein